MNLDFDKEIDAMLRETGRNGLAAASASRMHLDADDISAFAENALPDRTKAAYMLHLADCGDCRRILKDTVEVNAEAGPEPDIVYMPAVRPTTIPWYRKFILFPNIAYVMGGLVLVFSGFLGYVVLHNGGLTASELSRSGETYPASSEPANSALASNTAANMSASVSNETSDSFLDRTTANTGMNVAANTNSIKRDDGKERTAQGFSVDGATAGQPEQPKEVAVTAPPPAAADENADVIINVPKAETESSAPPAKQTAALPRESARTMNERKDDARLKAADAGNSASESRRVGGKRFERKQNVWYDSAYSGQRTTNVKRGSDTYRKLDSGLRTVAESLSGTVVVVWSGKAYRIQ